MNPNIVRMEKQQNGGALCARGAAAALILLLVTAVLLPGAQATHRSCEEKEKNIECSEFGAIQMDSQRDIRGEPITVEALITLDTTFEDRGTRWLMFSVRNNTADGSNPVIISDVTMTTKWGNVVTTREERSKSHETNLWVDVLDTPTDTPIKLAMTVGASDRGAYKLEVLVMAFDRGYAPVKDSSGEEASLFSFTLLGVNDETASSGIGSGVTSIFKNRNIPSAGLWLPVAALGVIGAIAARRRLL